MTTEPQRSRFEIVAATRAHVAEVTALARHLDTVNLPNDPDVITRLLEHSEASFARTLNPPGRREYVFLLRDAETGEALGTSMVIGQLGRRDAPYIYFNVRTLEKYSETLDRHFVHTLLDTTYSYDGPTELGGLVMDPRYRGHPLRLGKLISYVRFLFIAMRRADFRPELLAELLPPFRPDGSSALWEAVGRRFTGLSYKEADRLSRRNKEFIRGLFPDSIYATLLDDEARALIGAVGPSTLAVRTLLERIGFRYAARVDPFDGGPHFIAPTDRVSLVQRSRAVAGTTSLAGPGMIAVARPRPPYFRAVLVAEGAESGPLPLQMARSSGESGEEQCWFLPLD